MTTTMPKLLMGLLLIVAGSSLQAEPSAKASEQPSAKASEQPSDKSSQTPLEVLASIRPLALIARDLLGPYGQVGTLVSSAGSPHEYALKPSDMQRLQSADLIVWLGPERERFLEKPLRRMEAGRTLAVGETGDRIPADHDHPDLHEWLSPVSAQHMARQLAVALKDRFPALEGVLDQRLQQQLAAYSSLQRELKQALAPVKDRGFVSEHRGNEHFVELFGLNEVGWAAATPERSAGVRHRYALQKMLRELPQREKARCLFVESSHESADSHTLAQQLDLRVQTLDLVGRDAKTYEELMRNLVEDVVRCLSAS